MFKNYNFYPNFFFQISPPSLELSMGVFNKLSQPFMAYFICFRDMFVMSCVYFIFLYRLGVMMCTRVLSTESSQIRKSNDSRRRISCARRSTLWQRVVQSLQSIGSSALGSFANRCKRTSPTQDSKQDFLGFCYNLKSYLIFGPYIKKKSYVCHNQESYER